MKLTAGVEKESDVFECPTLVCETDAQSGERFAPLAPYGYSVQPELLRDFVGIELHPKGLVKHIALQLGQAKKAEVQRADISRVCNVDLDRFTIDRLVRIANQLERRVEVVVTREPQPKAARL